MHIPGTMSACDWAPPACAGSWELFPSNEATSHSAPTSTRSIFVFLTHASEPG